MKNMQTSAFFYLLLFIVLIPANCDRKEASKANESKSTANTGNELATGAPVTFVELGSVKCIPCRMMQPVMKDIESGYTGSRPLFGYRFRGNIHGNRAEIS